MLHRRKFLQASAALPVAALLPSFAVAQSGEAQPDFAVAGSEQTDPAGFEVAWSDFWTRVPPADVNAQPVPGQRGFIHLDTPYRDNRSMKIKQRVVFETNAVSGPMDPEELLNSFEDLHPASHMGYAPGTVIESRHLTDLGCWFSFGPGPNGGGIEGVIGLSLYYVPQQADMPLMNVGFNIGHGSFRTPEFLEEMDSTISLNGDWLLAMDDLGNFWDAIGNSYGYPDSIFD